MWSIKGYLTLLKAIVAVVLFLLILVFDIIFVNIVNLLLIIPLYLVMFSKCSSETRWGNHCCYCDVIVIFVVVDVAVVYILVFINNIIFNYGQQMFIWGSWRLLLGSCVAMGWYAKSFSCQTQLQLRLRLGGVVVEFEFWQNIDDFRNKDDIKR